MCPLQLDYRPRTLEEFFGNTSLKEGLSLVLSRDTKPHTYLFSGPSGCGKTTLARIVAKMLCCDDMDLVEYNISNMRGIDTARDIISKSRYEPLYGDVRVIILNECHKATSEFQNAMLEILEEPPSKVYFILCTTEPEKLLKTVKNRASMYTVSLLRKHEMIALILWILESEKKTLSEQIISAIQYAAEGCPRRALVILDQIIDLEGEEAQLDGITISSIGETLVIDICKKVLAKESGAKRWADLSILLKGIDQDAETVRRAILGYLGAALLNSKLEEAQRIGLLMTDFLQNCYDSGKPGLSLFCFLSTLK